MRKQELIIGFTPIAVVFSFLYRNVLSVSPRHQRVILHSVSPSLTAKSNSVLFLWCWELCPRTQLITE